jgi:hypothetical protein
LTDISISSRKRTSLLAKLSLVFGGILAAYLVITLLLTLFPSLVPSNNPYERKTEGTTVEMIVKITDGDMFAWFPGKVRPPAEDTILQQFTLSWDADGFRVPARLAERYPIAAFGDSFTEAANVPYPWPDKLAEVLEVPVYNYGYRDYGPLEVAKAVSEFAPKETRTWLLYAYFAGNDIVNNNRTTLIEERSPFFLMPHLAERAAGVITTPAPQPTSEHYDFPLPVIIGGNFYEMVFFPNYIWAQLAPSEGFEASRSFQMVGEQLDAMEKSVPAETCLALIFSPTKEQLYYRYIYESDHQWIRGVGQEPYIDQNRLIQYRERPYNADEESYLLEHLTDQRDAITRLMQSKSRWHFIDLLPAFEEAVGRGELLYYPYDTHWNQAGHALAAQVIADYLRQAEGCALS